MSPVTRTVRLLVAATVTLSMLACTSMDMQRKRYPETDQRLNHLLALYDIAEKQGEGCKEIWRADHAIVDCERIMREVERLATEEPSNERVLFASATFAYEAGRRDKAQYLLDQILDRPGAHVDAALLRGHIALEEGDTALARDLAERQIMLAPSEPELRELLASSYYVEGRYEKARAVLSVAGRLGAPGWRLSYHHGLISEAEKDWKGACRSYALSLEQYPGYGPALSRLTGLTEYPECRDPAFFRNARPASEPARPMTKSPPQAAAAANTQPEDDRAALSGAAKISNTSTSHPVTSGDNRVESISYWPSPDGGVEVGLTTSRGGVFVENLSSDASADEVVLDLMDVKSGVDGGPLPVNQGAARDVRVTEMDDRTRVHIGLSSPANYEILMQDNQVIVAISGAAGQ